MERELLLLNLCLTIFRNVQRLINALEPVLDDGAKLQMLHYLSELLPAEEQQAFDRAAARMISRKMNGEENIPEKLWCCYSGDTQTETFSSNNCPITTFSENK